MWAPPHPMVTMHNDIGYEAARARLQEIAHAANGSIKVESAGTSRTGRDLFYAVIGTGPTKVWVNARMRGAQTLTTPGALETIKALTNDAYRTTREALTILVIPVYHVDSTETISDYTEDGVDLEADWGPRLAPESHRWLKLFGRFKPDFAINYHSMMTHPYIEGTVENNAFQVHPDLIPAEALSPEQWANNRRMSIIAADAVAELGERPAKFWNHRNGHLRPANRTTITSTMLKGVQLKDGATHRVKGATLFEVQKNAMYRKDRLQNPGDDRLVEIYAVATLAVLIGLADGRMNAVDPRRYDDLPEGTFYTVGGSEPEWIATGEVPDWVYKKEQPDWLRHSFEEFARSRTFPGRPDITDGLAKKSFDAMTTTAQG